MALAENKHNEPLPIKARGSFGFSLLLQAHHKVAAARSQPWPTGPIEAG
jgi:hypothetical protein